MREKTEREQSERAFLFFWGITRGVGADFIGEELCYRRRVAWFWSSGVSFIIPLVYD